MVNKQMEGKFSNLKNVILLDTGSTLQATIVNPGLVTYIITISNLVVMMTNAGTKLLTLESTVKGPGHVWYNPTQGYSIFVFSDLKEKHRIIYDSDKEYAFMVHTKPEIAKVEATPEGLYSCKPPNRYLKDVDENKNMIPSSDVNGMELVY